MGHIVREYWYLFALVGALLLYLLLPASAKSIAKRREEFRVIHEGVLASVMYGDSGEEVNDTETTIVTFKDRQGITIPGHVDVGHSVGTRIRVLTDDNGCYAFEEILPA